MPLSNLEKQKRFRQKEALAQKAARIFNTWELTRGFDNIQNPLEVKNHLNRIADLPSGWTDEDYIAAEHKLDLFEQNTLSHNPHLLENDIWAGRSQDLPSADSIRSGKEAIATARNHVHLIISSFDLSKKRDSDNAAILMEVARNLGLSLLSEASKDTIPRSNATTICLLLANPMLPKPTWLLKAIATLLKEQLPNPRNQKELAEMLMDATR